MHNTGAAGQFPTGIKSGYRALFWTEKAPDFELPDQDGHPWRLAEHLAHGPVLLVFYRGDW